MQKNNSDSSSVNFIISRFLSYIARLMRVICIENAASQYKKKFMGGEWLALGHQAPAASRRTF